MDEVPELEELYDETVVEAIDRWHASASTTEPPRRGRPPRALLGAALAAATLGLAEVLDPEAVEPEVVELRPDDGTGSERWVSYLHVPGAPRASRLIIRPWLAPTA